MTENELAAIEARYTAIRTPLGYRGTPDQIEEILADDLPNLLAALRRERARVEEMRAALVRADSRLSLLRHRAGIQWGSEKVNAMLGPVWEYDQVIGLVRRLSEERT